MKLDLVQLMKQKTWQSIDKSRVSTGKKVLNDTCVLKLKRLPDGTPSKYKARYCIKGDP